MRNLNYLLVLVFFLALASCNNGEMAPGNLKKAREAAWNDLDEASKTTVTTDWSKAHVEVRDGQYFVLFNTTDDAILGPIGIYVNMQTFAVEGYTPRF